MMKNFWEQLPVACAQLDQAGRIKLCSPVFLQLLKIDKVEDWRAPAALLSAVALAASDLWWEAELDAAARLTADDLRFYFVKTECAQQETIILLVEAASCRQDTAEELAQNQNQMRQALLLAIAESLHLAEHAAHLDAIFNASPDMIFVHDQSGKVLEVNARASERFGLNGEHLLSLPALAAVSADGCVQRLAEQRLAAALFGAPQDFQWMARGANGEAFPVEVRLRALQGGRVATVAVVRDLSAENDREVHAIEIEGKFRALVEQSLVGIYIIQNGIVRYANPGMARMFGFDSPSEMIERVSAADLIASEARDGTAERLFCQAEAPGEGRFSACRHDGGRLVLEVHGRPFEYDGKPAVIGMLVDVTERCRIEAELERRAFYDALTGLPNRTLLFDRLDQALVRARRSDEIVAFLFLDLDGFKTVNDQYGHETGDQVLRIVAERLSGALRASDSLARLGGDEFAVIATGLTFGDDVVPVAEKLREALLPPIVLSGSEFQVGVSIGIALFPVAAVDANGLYKAADAAMYAAKQKCRGTYLFFDAAGTACTPEPPL